MLDRAEELAQILSPAFDTPTGIPYGTLRLGREYAYGTSYQVSLAESEIRLLRDLPRLRCADDACLLLQSPP